MADISINAVSTIPKYLTQADQWAIVPVSVAEELSRSSRIQMREMKNQPSVLYCYMVSLKSQNRAKSEMFELFYQVLEEFMDSMPYLTKIHTAHTETK